MGEALTCATRSTAAAPENCKMKELMGSLQPVGAEMPK